jgi:hypothetical protein
MKNNRNLLPAVWVGWISLVLGVWLVLSPWVLHYAGHPALSWNSVVLGVLVGIAGLISATTPSSAASWWNVAFGVWLFISPFLLHAGGYGPPRHNDMIVGVIVGFLGLAASLTRYEQRHRAASY